MQYCTRCGTEYQEGVERCVDCPEGELVSAEELRRRGLLRGVGSRGLPHEHDDERFVRVDQVEDPLTAETLTGALQAAGLAVFARPGRGGTVDVLTTGNVAGWWELLVPEEQLAQAQQVVRSERARLEAGAEEAARAAEQEERATEQGGLAGEP